MPHPGFLAMLRPFASRPRLVSAIAAGLAAGLALALIPNDLRWSTRAVLSWDVGCLWMIAVSLTGMMGRGPKEMQARAAAQDEGRHMILALVLVAAIASLATVGAELSSARGEHGYPKIGHVGLAFATVAASWFLVQLVFALHYAHEYCLPPAKGHAGEFRRGLKFPGTEEPDYWDFLHFAVVIGVASQTADIAFTSKLMRRIGTIHGLVAFTFNTAILALTINLAAALF